jgi:DNA invertase Pin-like site-specific DNA recombinase
MIAAIYARKSTEQHVADEAKSVTRQVENARAYAARLGWTVLPEHICIDDLEYVHGRSLTPKNWLDKAMSAVQAAADEAHREQSSERVHEAHVRLHQRGAATSGRVFGYTNQDGFSGTDHDGRPLRSHVERSVNPEEAAVVRRIFELYDSGEGLKRIAKLLTADGAVTPKHFRGQGAAARAGLGLLHRPGRVAA